MLRLYLKRASALLAMVVASNCTLETETDFKGARRDLLIIKLQNIVPF